mgnify:CR=1 FL=1
MCMVFKFCRAKFCVLCCTWVKKKSYSFVQTLQNTQIDQCLQMAHLWTKIGISCFIQVYLFLAQYFHFECIYEWLKIFLRYLEVSHTGASGYGRAGPGPGPGLGLGLGLTYFCFSRVYFSTMLLFLVLPLCVFLLPQTKVFAYSP